MSKIYGAASGGSELAVYCTPSTVVKVARKCTKNGEKLLVITSSWNGIKVGGAHCRLVIIYRDTSYKMIVYDPFIIPEYANIACGTQKPHERKCVENSIKKASMLLGHSRMLMSTIKSDELKGKVAIGTASTDGIGLEISRRLVQEGASEVISFNVKSELLSTKTVNPHMEKENRKPEEVASFDSFLCSDDASYIIG
uniref:Uncharacterized protein n=1 Tax=Tetranychus urticae TaxID=32264 RepID=T1KNJ0_TETUR